MVVIVKQLLLFRLLHINIFWLDLIHLHSYLFHLLLDLTMVHISLSEVFELLISLRILLLSLQRSCIAFKTLILRCVGRLSLLESL